MARSTVPPGQPGHLSLDEDHKGLHFATQLDMADPDAQSIVRKCAAGLLDGASFAFKVLDQDWSEDDDGTVRTITAVDVHQRGRLDLQSRRQ